MSKKQVNTPKAIQPPQLNESCEHHFRVGLIRDAKRRRIERASGDIWWSPRDGVRFRFVLPGGYLESPFADAFGMVGHPRSGLFQVPHEPSWWGTIQGGGEFWLIGASGKSSSDLAGFEDQAAVTRIDGHAYLAVVSFPLKNSLSFQDETPHLTRYFVPHFSPKFWPDADSITFKHRRKSYTRYRNKLDLQADPAIVVYRGETHNATIGGSWILTEEEQPEPSTLATPAVSDAKSFLSFLVGKRLPIYWWDVFPNRSTIKRSYVGTQKEVASPNGMEQPLPLASIGGAYSSAREIGPRLSNLFLRYRTIRKRLNLDFIMSPIWAAYDSMIEDRLALACVALERFATAQKDFGNSDKLGHSKSPLLEKRVARKLRSRLLKALEEVGSEGSIAAESQRIIRAKLEHIGERPNADKLEQAFTGLGVELNADEQNVLSNRNRVMHGNKTLNGYDLRSVSEDNLRFDILRTLIHKGMLSLLDYEGVYLDYSHRDEFTMYSIRTFSRISS